MSPAAIKETEEQYLKRKGWVKLDVPHNWKWQLPPAPGQHQLQHALDVQRSLDEGCKSKRANKKG